MNLSHVILEAYSNKNEDFNGTITYDPNPLEKYKEHKLYADCHISSANNAQKMTVKTSKEFICIMGWQDDFKYIKKK